MRNILDNPPILTSLPRTIDCFVDLDNAALGRRHDPLVFLLQRTRKNNVRIACRIVKEKINRYVKLELLERALDKVVIRQRDNRIERDRKQSANFAAIDLSEDLISVHAGFRQLTERTDTPTDISGHRRVRGWKW